jgi:hypothetical protein
MDGISLITPDEVLPYAVGTTTIYYARIPSAELSRMWASVRKGDRLDAAEGHRKILARAIKGWNGFTNAGEVKAAYPDFVAEHEPATGPAPTKALMILISILPGDVVVAIANAISAARSDEDELVKT